MDALSSAVEGGFADAVLDAQAVFRAVMDAMARPGTVQRIGTSAMPPAPFSAVAGAVALTLCDHDTPVWLDRPLAASEAVRAWLGFHTGAPIVKTPADAQFAFVCDPAAMPELTAFAQGEQEYPDRSATIVIQVEALDGADRLTLEGPGIETTARLAASPLPPDFIRQWQANRSAFPLGVDLIFCGDGAVAGLPRTTRIVGED